MGLVRRNFELVLGSVIKEFICWCLLWNILFLTSFSSVKKWLSIIVHSINDGDNERFRGKADSVVLSINLNWGHQSVSL